MQIFNGEIFAHSYSDWVLNKLKQGEDYHYQFHFSIADKFRLIDYFELKEARKSATAATYWAASAMLVSIVSTVLSLLLDLKTPEGFHDSVKEIGVYSESLSLSAEKLIEMGKDQNGLLEKSSSDFDGYVRKVSDACANMNTVEKRSADVGVEINRSIKELHAICSKTNSIK